ncbi:hypothetical protein [Thiomicrorhabdus heinhorstiae]|uniref:Uncharacterized protein n=1 Tax=Thiomicrorhabdus heinhorstiae TaxID=2748010 RepID=A0ABS0BYS7_9GAMM|nr:hypothetical protein [Thiomicrorhabdus heinhorstiae]MBF6058939.1 hypothetical protein [Thiomicrorhabdus heinhorstiae]
MVKNFFIAAALIMPNVALCQNATEEGKITQLVVHNSQDSSAISQRVRVSLSGTIQNDFCSTTGDWVINLNNEAAKAQYSLLLTSYMTGKEVKLSGNPSANCIAGQEVVRNIEFK